MDMLSFFNWCYQLPLGEAIRDSSWLFPAIEAVHLLGLALTAGAVLVVELRLLGAGLTREPVKKLAANAQPWLIGGVCLMFLTGVPLFISESIKCYYSLAFWVKMACLFLVLVYTFTLHRRVVGSNLVSKRPLVARSAALLSLALWFGVAWGGRWIGFS